MVISSCTRTTDTKWKCFFLNIPNFLANPNILANRADWPKRCYFCWSGLKRRRFPPKSEQTNLFCLLFCFSQQTKQIRLFIFWENLWRAKPTFGFIWSLLLSVWIWSLCILMCDFAQFFLQKVKIFIYFTRFLFGFGILLWAVENFRI